MIAGIVNAIQKNLLVCFPTETVYALACSALSSTAIRKIYKIKKRSKNKPLSILVNNINSLLEIVKLKKKYTYLVSHFSPGPITYVLPLKNNKMLTNDFFKENTGIRIPNHPIAVSILNELKIPIVATSINISGEKSIYKACNIPKSIKKHLSVIIEDDNLVSGKESTVIDLTGDKVKLLRLGSISSNEIVCF